jgi:pimeloyl-ACP methyl ester carboxylesterase
MNASTMGELAELRIDAGRTLRTLRYVKTGVGEPLVLLHTIRTQLDYFQAVIPRLAQHFTVYALDLPGHGYSSIDTGASYDEPYLRSGVIAFIEKLDLQGVTLVGESIGAVLALTVAGALPGRVKAVVASNAYDYDRHYGDGVRRGNLLANFILGSFKVPVVGAIFAALENRLLLGLIMRGGLHARSWFPAQLLAEFDRVGRRKGYRHVERSTFAGWRSWSAARSRYAAVKAPVKLVYGEHDWSTVEERARTARALGGIPVITIPGTGHFAFVDNPEKLLGVVLAETGAHGK